ncbi:TRAP transporter small permease subunit [candidate division KSB3 bacterium]|jgi:TRAP-type C4-dicarboxylate transport system permease small subunit|uniref:TRAP transporter small permease subunit n=1 Tax=candidate division KSB3 bacterium TaxID=2044937 RepID=A0A9D5JSX8_9BACT|nr:TRAP transporter small permease subunit [candidate division KSB3 bacterium]MBD3323406.1 TRAP transporter small permease subunit [candidate division KSB3 bacterium]
MFCPVSDVFLPVIRSLKHFFVAASDAVNTVVKYLCIVLVGVLVVLVLVTVFFRYVLNMGIGWSDELSRYINIWVALFGASIAFKYGDHVGIEFFRSFLPDKALRLFKFVMRCFICVFLVISEYYFFNYFIKSRAVTPAMQIPYSWIQASLFVGFAIMLIHLISFIFTDLDDFLSGNFAVIRQRKIPVD